MYVENPVKAVFKGEGGCMCQAVFTGGGGGGGESGMCVCGEPCAPEIEWSQVHVACLYMCTPVVFFESFFAFTPHSVHTSTAYVLYN